MDRPAPLPPVPRRVERPRAKPVRRSGLTLQAIVVAAVEVLDEAGIAGISMRRVAERLGTGAASLYGYVSGREELLELVFDELVGRVPLPAEPDPARWREQLTEMLWRLREILASHRDAALAGLGRVPTSPQTLRAAEMMVAVMKAGGLSDRAVALGLDQLILYVSAASYEAGHYQHSYETGAEVERYFQEVHDFYSDLPADRYPVLASIAPEMTGFDGEQRFQFGIEMLLAGLEQMSASER